MNSIFIVRKGDSFVDKVRHCLLKGREKLEFETDLDVYRNLARHSKRKLTIQDFGAGSKKLGLERSIGSIYKTSVATRKFQGLMFQLIQEMNAEHILEMGTSLGFSTVYLSKATLGKVKTIEACPQISNEAQSLFNELNLQNTELINSTFQSYFENHGVLKYDFVYVDGHHDGQALIRYIEILKPQLTENALVLVDDIRWSANMKKAWKTLLQDPFFDKNYDLFRMGILKRGVQ